MSLDEKGQQIAYQVAFKAAIELIAAGKAVIDPSKPIGAEVKELADALFAALLDGLPAGGSVVSARPPAPSGAAASRGTGEPPLLTDTPCPECESAGRNGVLLQNTDPSFKGPEFKCSLVQSRKVGNKFVDVGPCTFIDWGRNSKR